MNLQDILAGIGGSQALQDAASNSGVSPQDAHGMIAGLLEHAVAGGAAENVLESVASRAGVDPSLVQQFLPQVLPLLQGHADSDAGAGQPGLGGLIGTVGGLLGGGASAGGASSFLGAAQGLFGQSGAADGGDGSGGASDDQYASSDSDDQNS